MVLACWLGLLASPKADELGELHLIQARQALPSMDVWLELPSGSLPKPEQFSITLGSQVVDIEAIDAFRQTGEGVAYVFLVDISKSLSQQQFAQMQGALRHWLTGMGEKDRASLLSFGSEVQQRLGYTANQNQLTAVVDSLLPTDRDTLLYQALLEAIRLGRLQDADLPARRAIIVLSDGIDDALTGVTLDDVQRQSTEYRVPIYGIGFSKLPLDDHKRQGLKILGLLARQSGGHFVQAEVGELEQAYAQQHQHIMQAYRLHLHCQDCVADGQLRRLNLTWNDAGNIFSDGMDIRLLPASTLLSAGKDAWKVSLIVTATLIGIGLWILWWWLRRKRLAMLSSTDKPLAFIEVGNLLEQDAKVYNLTHKGLPVCLTVVTGAEKGREYWFDVMDSVLVGRASNCELCIIGDSEISNQHLLLKVRDSRLWVRDLSSTNGTWINGVPTRNEFPLRNNDLILLGRTELRVTGLRSN